MNAALINPILPTQELMEYYQQAPFFSVTSPLRAEMCSSLGLRDTWKHFRTPCFKELFLSLTLVLSGFFFADLSISGFFKKKKSFFVMLCFISCNIITASEP